MKAWQIAILAFTVIGLLAAAVALLVGRNSPAYDETAHRQSVEVREGRSRTDSDWVEYRNAIFSYCKLDLPNLKKLEAMGAMLGTSLEDDFSYTCPERIPDLH